MILSTPNVLPARGLAYILMGFQAHLAGEDHEESDVDELHKNIISHSCWDFIYSVCLGGDPVKVYP